MMISRHFIQTVIAVFMCDLCAPSPYSIANIKAVRGSLWSISVNKLSPIPHLQPVSAVYENQ